MDEWENVLKTFDQGATWLSNQGIRALAQRLLAIRGRVSNARRNAFAIYEEAKAKETGLCICPDCTGKGKVQRRGGEEGFEGNARPTYFWQRCETCAGKGETKKGLRRDSCGKCYGAGAVQGPVVGHYASGMEKRGPNEVCPACDGFRTQLVFNFVPAP
jgi:hypothetical protein